MVFPSMAVWHHHVCSMHVIDCPILQAALSIPATPNIIIMSYCFSAANYCRIKTQHLPLCVCGCINKELVIKKKPHKTEEMNLIFSFPFLSFPRFISIYKSP